MNKFLSSLVIVATLSVASTPALATNYHHGKKMGFVTKLCTIVPGFCAKIKDKHGKNGPGVEAVPEIDAANAGLALALIGGLAAIRRERRHRQTSI